MDLAPRARPAAECLLAAGAAHLLGCDKEGIILYGEAEQLRACRTDLRACLTRDSPKGTLRDALKGADVFIGLSVGNVVTAEDLDLMAPDRIVFALANPDPEVSPELGTLSLRDLCDRAIGLSESNQQCARVSRNLSWRARRAGERDQRSDEAGRGAGHRARHSGEYVKRGLHYSERVRQGSRPACRARGRCRSPRQRSGQKTGQDGGSLHS